jgi:hypothetical protein
MNYHLKCNFHFDQQFIIPTLVLLSGKADTQHQNSRLFVYELHIQHLITTEMKMNSFIQINFRITLFPYVQQKIYYRSRNYEV